MSWPCGPLSRLDSTDGHTRRLSLGATDCLLEQCFGVHTKLNPNSLPIKKTEQFVLIIFGYVESKIQCRLRIWTKKYHTCSSGLATNIMWLLWHLFMIWIKEPLLLKVLEGFALAKMGLDVMQNLWTLRNWLTHKYDFRWCMELYSHRLWWMLHVRKRR